MGPVGDQDLPKVLFKRTLPLLSYSVVDGSLASQFSSVQFSCSIVSDSLWPHEPQHARPPCPSPTPGVHSNPCPSSRWYHPTVSSSVIPFPSCPQSFPASGSFQMSQLFTSGGLLRPVFDGVNHGIIMPFQDLMPVFSYDKPAYKS